MHKRIKDYVIITGFLTPTLWRASLQNADGEILIAVDARTQREAEAVALLMESFASKLPSFHAKLTRD